MAEVVVWDEIRRGAPLPTIRHCDRPTLAQGFVARASARCLGPQNPDDHIPDCVGSALHAVGGARAARAGLGRIAQVLTPTDRALLDLAGRAPVPAAPGPGGGAPPEDRVDARSHGAPDRPGTRSASRR